MRSISEYIELTIAYMESDRGRVAWENNRVQLSMPHSANLFAAIQTATRLRRYEALSEVYAGLGPALNARRSGRVA